MTTLEKALRWIAIGGVFALPFVSLIIAQSLFFPFITGKNFSFRVIVEIMTGAWLALAIVYPQYRPKRSLVLGALALFVGVIAVADAQGVLPFKSFWSNYERMDGWVTLIHLLAYTAVAASVMTTENLWRRLFQTSLGVSAFLSVYGFLQIAGVTALGQGGQSGLTARIDATFGNPIYFAVYMLFHIFIAAMLWAQSWKRRGSGSRIAPSLLYGTVILLDTFALLFTGTRGTMIGLVGGTMLTALLLVFTERNSRVAWRWAAAVFAGLVILAGAFWMARDAAWIHRIGFLQRLATISLSDNTTKARIMNWQMAWKGVEERPLLGWGQENYAIVFDKYYDPGMIEQEPWFDRVHNIIFDWLVAGGILGLLSYLSIFAAALWALWRRTAEGLHVFTAPERSILTGLLAGYFVHNLFVFDNVTSYILFGTVLAFIAWRSAAALDTKPLVAVPVAGSMLSYAAGGAVLVTCVVIWAVNANAYAANKALLAGLAPQSAGLQKNLESFQKAISYGTFGTQEAREQLAQAAAQVAGSNASIDQKRAFYEAAVSEMTKQMEASPLDARFPLFLGAVHSAYGDLPAAGAAYTQALALSPTKQTIMFELGQNAYSRGDTAGALEWFKKALEIAPEFPLPRVLYAAVAIHAGQDALAEQTLAPIVESGRAADQRVLAAYVDRGEYAKIIPLWKAHIAASPDDIQAYFTLAAVYYQLGNRTDAVSVLEAAKAYDPSVASQADSLIQQVRAGTAQIGR